jgi:rare lipoprotein A
MRVEPLPILLSLALLLAAASGCASAENASRIGTPDRDLAATHPQGEPDGKDHGLVGQASWYGKDFHGRKTASGDTYDMYGFTAAHRTLPFHTVVRVMDLETRKSVVVRINDRGPFVDGRIIDLSYAAAHDFDMVRRGVIEVELIILRWGSKRSTRR